MSVEWNKLISVAQELKFHRAITFARFQQMRGIRGPNSFRVTENEDKQQYFCLTTESPHLLVTEELIFSRICANCRISFYDEVLLDFNFSSVKEYQQHIDRFVEAFKADNLVEQST